MDGACSTHGADAKLITNLVAMHEYKRTSLDTHA
jgi:hypothetical protein